MMPVDQPSVTVWCSTSWSTCLWLASCRAQPLRRQLQLSHSSCLGGVVSGHGRSSDAHGVVYRVPHPQAIIPAAQPAARQAVALHAAAQATRSAHLDQVGLEEGGVVCQDKVDGGVLLEALAQGGQVCIDARALELGDVQAPTVDALQHAALRVLCAAASRHVSLAQRGHDDRRGGAGAAPGHHACTVCRCSCCCLRELPSRSLRAASQHTPSSKPDPAQHSVPQEPSALRQRECAF